jgi:hypothetical protein
LDPDEEEIQHQAARAAFFEKWGKPSTSSSLPSAQQMCTKRKKIKAKVRHVLFYQYTLIR